MLIIDFGISMTLKWTYHAKITFLALGLIFKHLKVLASSSTRRGFCTNSSDWEWCQVFRFYCFFVVICFLQWTWQCQSVNIEFVYIFVHLYICTYLLSVKTAILLITLSLSILPYLLCYLKEISPNPVTGGIMELLLVLVIVMIPNSIINC